MIALTLHQMLEILQTTRKMLSEVISGGLKGYVDADWYKKMLYTAGILDNSILSLINQIKLQEVKQNGTTKKHELA